MRRAFRLGTGCAAVASAACLGLVGPASASDPPTFTVDLPAGFACDFDLRVEGFGETKPLRTMPVKDGIERTLLAGKGTDLDFTNLATGATYSLQANGSVTRTTTFADGSQELELAGHNVVILFPTDNPPGPSTVLYTGRVLISVDANAAWTLTQTSGGTVDICAALSG